MNYLYEREVGKSIFFFLSWYESYNSSRKMGGKWISTILFDVRFHELFHQRWRSEKPAWRKGNFYLADFEKFDVSRGYNGHGTERIVFSKQHILHRNALVLRARSKIAANGRSTVKSENLRNISSAKWARGPSFIARSSLDNGRKIR